MIIEYKNDTPEAAAVRASNHALDMAADARVAALRAARAKLVPSTPKVAPRKAATSKVAPFKPADREHSPVFNMTVRAHFNHRCTECNASHNLTIHHVESWEDHPELRFVVSNTNLLCRHCHTKLHNKLNREEGLRKYHAGRGRGRA